MPPAIVAVVGAIAVGGSYVAASAGYFTLAEIAFQAGVSLLLTAAAQAIGPKGPRAAPLSGVDVAYSGTLMPRRIIYGQLKISGMHVIPPLTSGSNNDYFHDVLALAGHPLSLVGDVFFAQIRIPSALIPPVTGGPLDGYVTGIPDPPPNSTNAKGYNNLAWIRRYDGTQTAVDYILNSQLACWDTNHIGFGIPYIALMLKYDGSLASQGVPEISVIVRGKKVYDPRQDSTNGGSGSQRYNDPTTWVYSTNPALCLRDFLTDPALGLGDAQTRINDVLAAAAANKCDELVTVPLPVLIGTTTWTNGSATVYGVGTQFTIVLNGGVSYIQAPNGSLLPVATVVSDVQLTLASPYAGAAATNQITPYNPTGNTPTTTQRRYSCHTALDATARFEDNIATLAGAMMGHCLYTNGQWCMYAGGWSGSAFSLTEDDLVGGVTMQCTTPRKDLFNTVRGNFISAQHNWQPVEFAPVTNAQYVADDGETLTVETNFPCCSNTYEAQRNAMVMTRQSRNFQVLSAQFGMSAFGIRVFETGTVTLAELGWVNQSVRCTGWKFQPQGVIELTLQEAYAADWTDPLVTDYSTTPIATGGSPGEYLPYPPNGLHTIAFIGAVEIDIDLPGQATPGSVLEVLEAATSAGPGTVVYSGTSTKLLLSKSDTTTRYYWARTKSPYSSQRSALYPQGAGISGAALQSGTGNFSPWVAVGAMDMGATDGHKSVAGASAWDAGFNSVTPYTKCHVAAKPNSLADQWAVGLMQVPFGGAGGAQITVGLTGVLLSAAQGTMGRPSSASATLTGMAATFSTGTLVASSGTGTTVAHDQPLTLTGSGFGTKSRSLTPLVWDPYTVPGPITAQFNSRTNACPAPSTAGGIYDHQQQPPGFAPNGIDIGSPHPFSSSIFAGCHLNPNDSQSGNNVMAGVVYTPPTAPYCARWEYYWRLDPGWQSDPGADCNIKEITIGLGVEPFPGANFWYTAFGTIAQTAISNVSNGNPCTVTMNPIQGSNPFKVGQRAAIFNIEGMTQIDGLIGNVLSVGGSSGAWTMTLDINSSAFSPYQAGQPVSGITKANPCVVTLSSNTTTNPFKVADRFSISGAQGMTQINGKSYVVQAIGGSQGAWTVTLYSNEMGTSLDTSGTGFTAYTTGGTAYSGGASSPFTNADASRQYTNNGAAGAQYFQSPDANGHNSSQWNQAALEMNPVHGWVKRKCELCFTDQPGLAPGGYFRVYDIIATGPLAGTTIITDYAGKTDNITTSPNNRTISMGSYARDRGPTQFRYHSTPHYDVSGAGVTGQCACVFVGDNPVYLNCSVCEPQVADSWADGSIHIPKFNQGKLVTGATVYPFVATEAGPKGTVVIPNNSSFVVGATSLPSITTGSLPNATHGVAYSTTLAASGGSSPYTWYVATIFPATGAALTINSSGVLSGTPTTAGTYKVFISIRDALGRTSYRQYTLTVA